ncbi:holin [Streptomonospora litoralis]|uniref:Holin n=1 Tax=Streptomonospora litoralis TaxID=2498135 RepID=A0A4P6Q3M4_9ACTN|nr:holin [Streptomonospora litoralis]QBI53414.1 hypothetical protein EKD16_08100 [Streptomonospora litoralis]
MFTVRFWRQSAELAARGAAHMALGAGVADASTLWEISAWQVLGAAGLGALLSVLTSLITMEAGERGSPLATRHLATARGRHRDESERGGL